MEAVGSAGGDRQVGGGRSAGGGGPARDGDLLSVLSWLEVAKLLPW